MILFNPSSKKAASRFSRKLTTVNSSKALWERPVGGGGATAALPTLVEVLAARGRTRAEDDAARREQERTSDGCIVIFLMVI